MPGNQENIKASIVSKTVTALRKGEVILYPTDTIWGLGCDAFNEASVDRIFNIKQRVKDKGFILLVDSIEMLSRYVIDIPKGVRDLIDVPGTPVTAVYSKVRRLPPHLLSTEHSVAIRIVQHDLITAIITSFDQPIVSTSANTSGNQAPSGYNSIEKSIKEAADLIIPPEFDTSMLEHPSRMVIIGEDGGLNWIR